MLKFLGKLLVIAFSAIIVAYILPGVAIKDGISAIILAFVLSVLNNFVKPILVVLTIPITLFTFGLFLIVINVLIIKWAAAISPGVEINTWWTAFLFSILLSIVVYLIESLIGSNSKQA